MSLYRVVISYMYAQVHHIHERGVYAMTPGQALDEAINKLNISPIHTYSFKTWVNKPESIQEFARDAFNLPVIGSDMRLEDLWRRKHGDV